MIIIFSNCHFENNYVQKEMNNKPSGNMTNNNKNHRQNNNVAVEKKTSLNHHKNYSIVKKVTKNPKQFT